MTTFLLIRHAAHDLLGRVLAGRAPGVHLNSRGQAEAEQLADRLASEPLRAIFTGPLERARETALPLATRLSAKPQISAAFDEIDFGQWTSCAFEELNDRDDWRLWNSARSQARPPGGESMADVQQRCAAELERLARGHPDEMVAIFSHGDVIKATLMHYLGIPVDHHARLEISPASISTLTFAYGQPQVTAVNHVTPL